MNLAEFFVSAGLPAHPKQFELKSSRVRAKKFDETLHPNASAKLVNVSFHSEIFDVLPPRDEIKDVDFPEHIQLFMVCYRLFALALGSPSFFFFVAGTKRSAAVHEPAVAHMPLLHRNLCHGQKVVWSLADHLRSGSSIMSQRLDLSGVVGRTQLEKLGTGRLVSNPGVCLALSTRVGRLATLSSL